MLEQEKEPSKVFPQYLAATAGKILKISLCSLKWSVLIQMKDNTRINCTDWELLHSSVVECRCNDRYVKQVL
jgi:hypothetical protein